MKIDLNEIFDFFEMRTRCHVKSVNYFADFLGCHFPEHDGDKIVEPMRTGYAYIFYGMYHKDFYLSPQQLELCDDAKSLHHNHSPHHVQYYKSVKDIPDVRLNEMMSDWASANFEQKNVICIPDTVSISQWFDKNLSHFEWSERQIEFIQKTFENFRLKTDEKVLMDIWKPLLKKSDL